MATFPTLPGSYCTVDLLIDFRPQLNSISTVNSAHLSRAIGLGEGEMNAKLAKKFPMPFTVEIPYLTLMSLKYASYFALARHYTQAKMNLSQWVMQEKEDADKMMQQVLDDEIELLPIDNNIVDRGDINEAWSDTQDFSPTTRESAMEDWEIDRDKVDSERNDRL